MDLAYCRLAHGDHGDGRCSWCGSPRPTGRTRWCSDRCQRAYAANHVWAAARAYALDEAGRRCQICSDPEDLEVHHDPPIDRRHGYGNGCHHHQDRLIVLCAPHHEERHRALRARPGTTVQLTLLPA